MAKFATPVAMKVVAEKQGIELVESLEALGYRHIHKRYVGYVTTAWNGGHNLVTILDYKPDHRHIIEEYNPELFLAIAAMTEDEIPIIGEWLSYKERNRLFRVESYGRSNNYNVGRIDKENPNGSGYLLKSTLEELTNHFSKPKETFVLPKKWKLEVTEENVDAVNKWRSSVGYVGLLVLATHDGVNESGLWVKMSMTSASEIITTEQFMEHVYKPAFNKEIPEEFYIHYCEGFTEDIFHALYDWAKEHSSGEVRGHDDTYENFNSYDRFWRFNFTKAPNKVSGGFGYGVDNHDWTGKVKTEYTLEQVKELINYNPKTNKNEYKEDSYESESRESIKQIDEDLDSISSREGGKEIKIRTVSSRNLCERGSIESSNSITSPRGSSSRIRAERGRLYI